MTRYAVSGEASALAIEITELAGHTDELLAAFGECQAGRCSCPTDEYEKVAAMDVRPTDEAITIRLAAKPGTEFDRDKIEACLDYTVGRSGA